MKQGVIRRLTGGLRGLCLTAACSLGMLAETAGAQAPSLLPVQGFLTDKKGAPVDGETDLRFRLYSSSDPTAADTQVLFEELQTVSVKQGNFTIYLGDAAASGLDLALFASHPNVWLGIKVAGESSEMSPLLQLATVPYAALAQKAQDASSLSGKKVTDFLAASYVPDWSGLSGKPGSFPPSAHRHPWSDLDGIPSSLADGDNDSFAAYTCSNAQILKSTGSGWSCANETTLTEAQVDA
jgi:hypothetical protein